MIALDSRSRTLFGGLLDLEAAKALWCSRHGVLAAGLGACLSQASCMLAAAE